MDAALSEEIGRTLRDFRAVAGDGLLDRERCGSALLDTHKQYPAAIRAVLAAIDSGGARRLSVADPALASAAIENETRRLISDFAMTPEFARGAMRAWTVALGLEAGGHGAGQAAGAGKSEHGGKTGDGKKTDRLSLTRQVLLVGGGAAAAVLAFWAFRPPPPRPPPIVLHVSRWEWLPGGTPASRRVRVEVVATNLAEIDQTFPDFTVYLRDRNDAIVRSVAVREPQPRFIGTGTRWPFQFILPVDFSTAESSRIAWFEAMPEWR